MRDGTHNVGAGAAVICDLGVYEVGLGVVCVVDVVGVVRVVGVVCVVRVGPCGSVWVRVVRVGPCGSAMGPLGQIPLIKTGGVAFI